MAVSSYGSLTDSSGVVRILKDLDAPIEGKDVLIVEDIVDSGLTLNYLLRNLRGRNPRSLEVCALLVKPARRKVELPIRYVGFEIPNRFVVGYGLDLDQRYRNLPYVAAVDRDPGQGASHAAWQDALQRARKSTDRADAGKRRSDPQSDHGPVSAPEIPIATLSRVPC